MAAFVATMFATSGITAAAGGGAAAGAGGLFGAGGILGTGLSAIQLASSGLTSFSALKSIHAAGAEAAALKGQAAFETFEAKQEEIRGIQRSNRLQEDLLDTLASQRVAFLANGIDISAGTPATARDEAVAEAERQISTTRNDAMIASLTRRQRSRALLQEARSAKRSGYAKAVGSAGKFVYGQFARGGVPEEA